MSAIRMRRSRRRLIALLAVPPLLVACGQPGAVSQLVLQAQAAQLSLSSPAAGSLPPTGAPIPARALDPAPAGSVAPAEPAPAGSLAPAEPAQPALAPTTGITISFAGDVNFAERTADLLTADPATAFGAAAPGLAAADLTVVNLETAITTGGIAEPKSFTFRAPPTALAALKSAGIDVASMANNHGADYGEAGLLDTVAAIAASGFPVIGIGADDAVATAPYRTTIKGVEVAIFAASQVQDRTLLTWTATADRPGIANAFDPRLLENVRAAAAAGTTVIVFLHWGTEYDSCPDGNQQQLAAELAAAGATAVVGAHAHVLQGAGWRPDGVYVAYGLSNYLWWRSFGNEQDDNGVLTLKIEGNKVIGDHFAPSHLADDGVPMPAIGGQADRINADWEQVRRCAELADTPPA
ncbi:MAG: CapA family protein [Nakamurella sp.]